METLQKLNLLGLRKRVILYRIKGIKDDIVDVMEAITEEQENELDTKECTTTNNGTYITRKEIYIYGDIDITSEEDISYIKKFKLFDDSDKGNQIHSNFNFIEGTAEYYNVPKFRTTWDAIEWFKYNYCLIGKPAKIVIYRINKSSL